MVTVASYSGVPVTSTDPQCRLSGRVANLAAFDRLRRRAERRRDFAVPGAGGSGASLSNA